MVPARPPPSVPVVATLVFARGRTMFGDRPADAAAALAEHGVVGVGANCGDGFASVEDVIGAMAGAVPGLHVIAKANAGAPQREPDGRTVYPATADEAAAYARRVADAGATIIGGLLRDDGGPHRRHRGRPVRAVPRDSVAADLAPDAARGLRQHPLDLLGRRVVPQAQADRDLRGAGRARLHG